VELTKRQRNEIFEALQAKGVDPDEYSLEPLEGLWLSTIVGGNRIVHAGSGSWMDVGIGFRSGKYMCALVIAGVRVEDFEHSTWSEVIDHVRLWVNDVVLETSGPDFWAELQEVHEVLTAAQAADASNTPFTSDEQAEISTRIDQAKDVVRRENPELAAEQLSTIEQTLDEVKEASTRIGRKDWMMLANGALLSLIVNDVVPAHVVQSVFNMLISGISHLFGLGGSPMITT
jgi:frataxin-like iron-binding protein CyaY